MNLVIKIFICSTLISLATQDNTNHLIEANIYNMILIKERELIKFKEQRTYLEHQFNMDKSNLLPQFHPKVENPYTY